MKKQEEWNYGFLPSPRASAGRASGGCVGGKKSTGYGTACVVPDGTWLIDENG